MDQSAVPSVGTTWVYDQSVLSGPAPYGGKTGPLTITYQGQNAYRGGTYFTFTSIGVAGPPQLTSYYAHAGNGDLAEFAGAFYNFTIVSCASPQQEDVLDTPLDFTAPASNVAENETSYRCGFPPAVSQTTLAVLDGGTQTLTLPSGSYHVAVRQATLVTFGQKRVVTDYVAGMTTLRRDAQVFDTSGNVVATTTVSYRSGPLNVSFPGPAMLLSQYY